MRRTTPTESRASIGWSRRSGTTLSPAGWIAEAHAIVFEGRMPAHRPKDAHDVIGTFRVLSSRHEMFVSASEWVDRPQLFLDVLQSRHRTMLQERPELRSGEFKEVLNQAGDTLFVAPELVETTLIQGLQRMRLLEEPFQRAVYMMFLVAEVHPFDDGNGRIRMPPDA